MGIDLMDHLYPEIIYRFNQLMLSCWEEKQFGNLNGIETADFTCSFFSSHTRTFHWVSIAPVLWSPKSKGWTAAQGKLKTSLLDWHSEKPEREFNTNKHKERKDAWEHLLKDLPPGRLYGEAKKDINVWLENKPLGPDATHRTILALYSGYHNKAPVNVEGIFFRLLAKCGNHCPSSKGGLDALLGTLENVGRKKIPPFDWFKPENPCSGCDRPPALKTWENIREPEDSSEDEPEGSEQIPKPIGPQELLEIFFGHLLSEPEAFGKKIAHRRNIALIPIYDVWREGRGFGGIKAIVLTFFGDQEEQDVALGAPRDQWLELNYPRLRNHLPTIAAEVAVSAETLAVSQVIEPPYDLLRHFLKVLTFLQDWECASVVDTRSNRVLYSYRREAPAQGQSKWGWKYSESSEVSASPPDENISRDESGNWFMWWTTNLWSMDLIPGFGQDEMARFSRFAIRLQFPVACRITALPEDRRFLRQVYLRQQLSLMRLLIPKIQARRAALRSAVSAIMGRNMSHNIGSHVLARYASKAGKDLKASGTDKADHRSDFLAYLQRRMDFLAEVATSDQAFWSQPLSLEEQVNRLNYAVQQKRIADSEECHIDKSCAHHLSPGDTQFEKFEQHPILLSFITGKESLLASVEYGSPVTICQPTTVEAPTNCCLGYKPGQQNDCWFACPGGEVGLHALFVIFENIIRNSARHGGAGNDTIRIFSRITDYKDDADYLELELIDPRTRLHKDGRLFRDDEASHTDEAEKARADEAKKARAEVGELRRRRARSLYEDEGKRKTLVSVWRNINSILHDEPFLDASGTPNPNYWGVREMQICAHYIRGYSLADLEGVQSRKSVLKAGKHYLGDGRYCLKYRIYLQRAKQLAVVVQDSSPFARYADAFRSKGIVLIRGPNSKERDGWRQIAKAARDYSFLAVETGITIPETESVRVSLPVRRLPLDLSKINLLVSSNDLALDWMDSLHKLWAELCRDRRGIGWKGKKLYGIVIGRDVLNTPGNLPTTPPESGDGMFWVSADKTSPICPVPFDFSTWHARLKEEVIAAAWVDHPGAVDFDKEMNGRLGLAAASVNPELENRPDFSPRVWISAEGATADSPHTGYLVSCRAESGWELLAAAVPRVVVLDERVQSEQNRDTRAHLPLSKMWPLMGVWVPRKHAMGNADIPNSGPPFCNLDTPDFSAIHAFLKKPAQREDQYPVDFLVIHLTILERLKKETGYSLPQVLGELKKDTPAKMAEVIVVTGRGVPSMARRLSDDRTDSDDHIDTVRYLPISALLESLILRPSKLALMRVLWSARRPDGNSQL